MKKVKKKILKGEKLLTEDQIKKRFWMMYPEYSFKYTFTNKNLLCYVVDSGGNLIHWKYYPINIKEHLNDFCKRACK